MLLKIVFIYRFENLLNHSKYIDNDHVHICFGFPNKNTPYLDMYYD